MSCINYSIYSHDNRIVPGYSEGMLHKNIIRPEEVVSG